jgi:hypothetical protein
MIHYETTGIGKRKSIRFRFACPVLSLTLLFGIITPVCFQEKTNEHIIVDWQYADG